jgi:acyl-[acyl-carrier-protein]-phospholipid O-acyltransferase/long-chain-fatty-acid--[acyl-carrier-protein] ligase
MIEQLGKTQKDVGVALAILAAGVGLGSVLGGFLSGGRVELGLVPLGAAAIAAGAMLLFAVPQAYPAWLLLLGTGGGIFDVPLAAFMQHRSPSQSRGAILAASNFLTFSAMLLVAGLFYLLHGVWQLGADTIFLLGGIGTLPVLVYSWALLPWATARLVVWIASHTVYRVRVYGREHLPEQGPALLVANHVSWADGIFLMMSSSRPLRVIADASQFRAWPLRVLARMAGVIPISGGPKAIARALDTAHAALAHGELVCVFAEGQMTRTGQLQAFRRGLVEIIQGTGAPIVPVYLDELWGSLWSRRGGQFFWKWPRQWPYPVTIVFGRPCASTDDPRQIRDAVALLGTEAARLRRGRTLVLPRRMLRCMRRMRPRIKITDSTGQSQSGRQFLFRTLVLMRVLRRRTSEDDPAPMIGLLVPPSAAGATANAAAALLRRVAVNLNPMLPEGELDACIAKCRIRHVVTSRRYLDLTGIKPAAEIVALEDVRSQATATDVVVALLGAYVLPVFLLERLLRLTRIRPDDLMAVFFTSGTTGQPKGVMLSHDNVGSNATALEQILDLTPRDVILGVLPWYHSFGYTATLWTTLAMRPTGAFHHTALDARRIGKLCERTKATLLIAPPSFLRAYLRRCTPEQFASLETIITGAEWMSVELADAFRETFGVEIQASYGATELSPVVSCNVPDVRMRGGVEIGSKAGTVGRPIPNVAVKVVDIDTGEPVGRGAPGRLLVAGPGVMLGYLDEPEETARKIHDRWYDTGDVATIDDDGFLTITGRLSRFSKIGGEMVPHVAIEAAIEHMLGPGQGHRAVVTALPDGRKGERLIVVHADLGRTPRQVCAGLAAAGLPKLWLPTPESFLPVDRIPLLGSGKIALAEVERIVRERFGAS